MHLFVIYAQNHQFWDVVLNQKSVRYGKLNIKLLVVYFM